MVDMTTRDYDEKIQREIQKTERRLTKATQRLYYDRGDLAKFSFTMDGERNYMSVYIK